MKSENSFTGKNLRLTPSRILVPFLIFVLTLPLLLWINSLIENNLRIDRILKTAKDMATVRAKISSEINTSLHLLHGLSALIQANPDLTDKEFKLYAAALRPKGKGIISIAVAPDYVISYIYPVKGNESALGLDYRVTPNQWIAVKKCVELRDIVVAGPLTLIQGQTAVVGRSPVFIKDKNTGEHKLWGIVSMPMSFERLLDNTSFHELEEKYEIAIRGRDSLGASGEVFYGNPDIFLQDPVITPINLPTGTWQMASLVPEAAEKEKAIILAFNIAGFSAIVLLCLVAFLVHKNILVIRDSERSLRLANESIERRYAEISVLNKDLEAFNYSISNTLKAPLRHIAGYSKILFEDKADQLDEETGNLLKRIYNSTGELGDLLNSLHRLSIAARQGIECSPLCLKALATSAFKKAKEIYQANNVELVCNGEFKVSGDMQLLKIAIEILIDNCIKFTLNVKNPQIKITGSIEGNKHIFTITDNGTGFETSAAEAIFVPYHSYHTHGDFSGIGLGLATAKRIIERHGGSIKAVGEKGKGATFIITLKKTDCPSEDEQPVQYSNI